MLRLSFPLARGASRATVLHPALAGFRPAAAALAIAAAFGWPSAPLRAQPVGGQAIAGQATFATSGNNLVVTTQNAAGTNHSAINWQSFSVPAGSLTRFNQPSAASTSINRVLGPDPSSIFGTLSSNGKLVLVNPAGIAVGKGAVVDTAGFTASTLPMSEADAIAGRMRFAGNGGALQVDGSIVARSGDVVLIATNVQTGTDAVVQANGAAVLAAGQKVEITGRGLEGIRMEVQAPQNQAVNLGTLQGDAVGIFAGTLKHSGLVQAQAVSTDGGKVVLKAQGDNLVSGGIQAAAAGGKGGSVDVLGQRVGLLAGAAIDASGANGGGQVRVGGDYQGLNPDVQNAQRTYVDAQASIKADATVQGDGGRVIVWADDTTRMRGRISARGGVQGGNGGFAEVSGKSYLDFTGRADLRAPRGTAGTLLLDPTDIEIRHDLATTTTTGSIFSGGGALSTINDADLSAQLETSNVQVTTSAGSFSAVNGGRITLFSDAKVDWRSGNALSLQANTGIVLAGTITATTAGVGNGSLHLLTQSGDIAQVAGSRIQVAKLIAEAGSLASPGGRVLLNGAGVSNQIGTVAGHAYGPSAQFLIDVAGPLNIGSVSIPYGSGNGIVVNDGASNGLLVVNAGGDLNVQPSAQVYGGPVQLTSSAGSIVLGSASMVDAHVGRLDLDAFNNVTLAYYAGVEGGSGAGGGIHILARSGNVDFGPNYLMLSTIDAPIEVTAGSSILGNAMFQVGGALGGSVHLTATNGSISYGSISTAGSSAGSFSTSGDGGEVILTARGNISGNGINAYGGDNTGWQGGRAGNGGTVKVDSSNGSVTIGAVQAQGGSSNSTLGSGGGGRGGAILLRAGGGSLSTAGGDLTASGGSTFSGNGGDGGSITVSALGDVQLAMANASGGDGSASFDVATAKGGNGGVIQVTSSNGNISFGARSGSSITSYGGAIVQGGLGGLLTGGGGGGAITVIAKGPTAGTILATYGLSAAGGDGADAGPGGSVTVNTNFDVDTPSISASGGQGSAGSRGGDGGAVNVAFGQSLALSSIDAMGGHGGDGDATRQTGGNGGNGGNIAIKRTGAGDVRFGGMQLYANGGSGGGTSVSTAGGGTGGGGGVITVEASAGSLFLSSVSLAAGVGAGGLNGDGMAFAPNGSSPGAVGVRARDNVDLSGTDLSLGNTRFAARAGGNLVLADAISSDAAGDAVVLAANSVSVGANGAINTPNGRWLVYVGGPLGSSNFGTLASGNLALWNRAVDSSPPPTVTEPGNRYLFAFQPVITINANAASKVYDGTAITIDPQARTVSPPVDASAYGNVFLQDAPATATVTVAKSSKNVGDYGVVLDTVNAPAGYAIDFHPGTASITKRSLLVSVGAQNKAYDATTAAQAFDASDNRVAGDDLALTVGSATFADKNAGTGKTVSVTGLGLAGADAGNYSLSTTSASVKADITPAPVTVTANNQGKAQGTTLVFNGTEFTASGLKGGESVASVNLFSAGAPADAPVGVYAITPSAAVGANGFLAGNYIVSYLNGALAVGNPAEQQQVLNQVVVFSTLFIEQAKAQDDLDKKKIQAKDDIVVTDTQCKPS